MKASFRDHFRDYVHQDLKESFDSLNDVVRSKLMARFFAERVLRPRNPTLLPFAEEDIQACMVDGKGDLGVDFIAREEGIVLVVQAKFSGGKKQSKRQREDLTDFESFRNVLSRLRDYRSLEMNERLREVAADIDWDTDAFQLYYITLRQLAANQEQLAAKGITPVKDVADIQDRAELNLFDETQLNNELRDTLSLERDEAKSVQILFSRNDDSPPWVRLGSTDSRACYVGRVSGSQLARLFTEHKSSLFTLNIRNYIGDNVTNKGIKRTALEAPTEFMSYNNGISALATRIEPDKNDESSRTLVCQQLSIVNGAQTVRSLHKAHVQNPDTVRDVQVLLRITEFSTKKTREEQEFLDNVTKYNNTQNSIRLSDFRSNDKVQYDIKKRFEQLPALGGKKFLYKNKRSGEREAGRIPIGMEEFVKTLYAFQFGPDDVYGGTGHVFDATKEGGYAKLFGSDGEILPALDNQTFELYAGIWFICFVAKDLWRRKSRDSKDPALERRWMFFYALGEGMREAYRSQGKDVGEGIRALAKPSWINEGTGSSIKMVVGRFSRMAFKALSDAYRASENKEGFAHRNWFRSEATLRLVTEHLRGSWELLAEHGDDYILSKPK